METLTPGLRIRAMRQARNMSREALAVEAGVSGTTVMRAEQGKPVGHGSLFRMLAILAPDMRITDLINQ